MSVVSPLANLFLAVQERIATIPAIKWIDQDFGQLDISAEEYKPPVLFPCVLFDLTGITFEDKSSDTQNATGILLIKLSTAPYIKSNQKTPILQREKALEHYELEYEISKKIHGWRAPGFGRFTRTSLDKQDREDSIRERLIAFSFSYTEKLENSGYTKRPIPEPVFPADRVYD